MLGEELMGVLYRNYSVPKVEGRYVDMGMSFKKGDMEPKRSIPSRRPKRKPGELRELVHKELTTKWESAAEIGDRVDAARESVRSCLEALTRLKLAESFGQYKDKQYRRKK